MEQLPIILGALILAGILWIAKTVNDHSTALATINTVLIGASGANGLAGEVKGLREAKHDQSNQIHGLMARIELLDQRATQNERNIQMLWDGTDRRTGQDRRDDA